MVNAAAIETSFPLDSQQGRDHSVLVGVRLFAGLAQGVALYLIYLAADNKVWPATDAYWMAPLLMVFVFAPLLFMQAVGAVRWRTLLMWIAAAIVLLALLGWLDVWRQWDSSGVMPPGGNGDTTFALVAFTIVGLFIAQSLITAADLEYRYVASYATYFEAAWKLEIQLLLAALFVGVFWAVLWLGAVLFNLIGIHVIEELITEAWFVIPASALATAAALHVTDVRARLVAGIRTVVHTLLSWLLPLMVLIGVGFTLSLPFTGLAPLWATRSAAGILLAAAGALVILINAAFQDGDPAHNRAAILRYAELAAAFVLVPLVSIAAYALWLRVAQYGWTVERIATAATILVALTYAFGYAAAAVMSLRGGSVWMALVARVNICAAFLVLAVLMLLFTPLADPARLAVNSQVGRLEHGAVTPDAFDYTYLHTEGGRYGRQALTALANAGSSDTIRRMAKAALSGQTIAPTAPSKADIEANLTVYPSTRALPAGFASQDWSKVGGAPTCMTMAHSHCDVFYGDFNDDGNEEIVLTSISGTYLSGTILKPDKEQVWVPVATLNGDCAGMLDALKKGQATLAPPRVQWRDWVILGVHLHPSPNGSDYEPCPR